MITPNTNTALSEIFDIELSKTDKSIDELKIAATVDSIDSLSSQREYVKTNIVKLLEKGSDSLDSMIAIAKSTEVGKDFAVVSDMIKTLVDTNMKLLDSEVVHKQPEKVNGQTTTNNNTAVFVGSTAELSRYLKNQIPNESVKVVENK
jgi:hypothetical protein